VPKAAVPPAVALASVPKVRRLMASSKRAFAMTGPVVRTLCANACASATAQASLLPAATRWAIRSAQADWHAFRDRKKALYVNANFARSLVGELQGENGAIER